MVVLGNENLIAWLEPTGADRVPEAVPRPAKQAAAGIVKRKGQRFSGPADKLSAESGELEYRLVTTDAAAARELAAATTGMHLVDGPVTGQCASGDAIVVRTAVAPLDDLVVRLVQAGIAIRELALVISPLEAAFLALTETQTETQEGDR